MRRKMCARGCALYLLRHRCSPDLIISICVDYVGTKYQITIVTILMCILSEATARIQYSVYKCIFELWDSLSKLVTLNCPYVSVCICMVVCPVMDYDCIAMMDWLYRPQILNFIIIVSKMQSGWDEEKKTRHNNNWHLHYSVHQGFTVALVPEVLWSFLECICIFEYI